MINKFNILITEDDSRTRTLLSNYLTEKGYEVFSAENGLEGLRILEHREIDLVITDYGMPRMDGKEFILQIKKIHPRLPVILVSGFGLNENKDLQSIQGILFDYFQKPINLGLLQKAIQNVQQEIFFI
jgi:two-component system, NtrC family, response regulator GlrR